MSPDPISRLEAIHSRGRLLVLVGPSGAGKDSLIACAKQALSGDRSILFVRRVVTRATPSGEDHDCLSPDEFAVARRSGQFAVHWEAHGLSYGVPATVFPHLDAGGVAVLNGSRAALPAIRAAFEPVTIVHVTASPDILAKRLAMRGRETEADILRRLHRSTIDPSRSGDWVDIDNSGPIEIAAARFLATIRRALIETRGSLGAHFATARGD